MTERSDKPFADALRELMDEQELSFRKLAYMTAQHRPGGKSFSLAYLAKLASGEARPTAEAMAAVARAAGAPPEYFREYREWVAAERARELTSAIGLDRVLAALAGLDAPGAGSAGAADGAGDRASTAVSRPRPSRG